MFNSPIIANISSTNIPGTSLLRSALGKKKEENSPFKLQTLSPVRWKNLNISVESLTTALKECYVLSTG